MSGQTGKPWEPTLQELSGALSFAVRVVKTKTEELAAKSAECEALRAEVAARTEAMILRNGQALACSDAVRLAYEGVQAEYHAAQARAQAAEARAVAAEESLADLHDCIRTAYIQCPPLPICAEYPEAFDAATDTLHSLCLIVGIHDISVPTPPDDTAIAQGEGEE